MKRGQVSALVQELRGRIPPWLFRFGQAYVFELPRQMSARNRRPFSFPADYSARYATRNELPAVAAMAGLGEAECSRRMDSGDKCFSVFHTSRLVNVAWIHFGPCYVRGVGYHHPGQKSDAYIYNILTDPAERGKGLYKNALLHLSDELFRSQADRLVQLVEPGNVPVLHTLPQLGYVHTATISHVTLCGVKCTTVRNPKNKTIVRRIFRYPPDVFRI